MEFESSFFYLRTPLLPFNKLKEIYEEGKSGEDEMDLLAARLKYVFSDRQLKEAIYLASPVLFDELEKYLANPGQPLFKGNERLVLSLFQYYSRLCTRCTPFGLFAGSNLGFIHNGATDVSILSRKYGKGHLRLDMDFVASLSKTIEKNSAIDLLNYFTNSSIYRIRDKIRYIEVTHSKGGRRYKISTVDNNPLLNRILLKAKSGLSFKKIAEIGTEFSVSITDTKEYLIKIIEAGLLISNLEPNVTGKEFMNSLMDNLQSCENLGEVARQYSCIINNIGHAGDKEVSYYRDLKKQLASFNIEINEAHLFQVDLVKESQRCFLNENTKKSVLEVVFAMAKLNSQKTETRLEKFKKKFEERYETKEVSLAIALDPDIGINYETLPVTSNSSEGIDFFDPNSIALFKFNKYQKAITEGLSEIHISQNELIDFSFNKPLPDSFSAMIRLHEMDADSKEPKIEFRYATGPSGAKTLGRFCHCDINLHKEVNKLIEYEEEAEPGKIFAEISHLPEDRIGNVITRPVLRKYEISLLAKSGRPNKFTIYVDDLYLKIEAGRLNLYSRRLKKQIIPRLTNSHNYSNKCLQLYHFLCELQMQNLTPGAAWNWNFLSNQPFLPRVLYKSIIVNPATWNIYPKQLSYLNELVGDKLASAFNEWKVQLKLPGMVYLAQSDNELLLNLDHPVSIHILKKEAKKGLAIQLREAFNLSNTSSVNDENGNSYTSEIVMPFFCRTVSPESSVLGSTSGQVTREFPIGTKWVYFKLYTGEATADILLKERIFLFFDNAVKDRKIERWFFLRYSDPGFHLRIRFCSKNAVTRNSLIKKFSQLMKPFLDSGEINDMSMHAYRRELERYGGHLIGENEEMFFYCSQLVGKILGKPANWPLAKIDFRMGSTLKAVDKIISLFFANTDTKLKFCLKSREAFANEFKVETTKQLREQIKSGYRAISSELPTLLAEGDLELFRYLHNDFLNIENIISQLLEKTSDEPEFVLTRIASSQVHMFVNRITISNPRLSEFFVYEYLCRYYQSVAAQKAQIAFTTQQ